MFLQRGQEAADAANTFPHVSYEGGVDLEAMDDPVTRAAVEEQIKSFGQTPTQLFTAPHLQRQRRDQRAQRVPAGAAALLQEVTPGVPITFMAAHAGKVLTISSDQSFWLHQFDESSWTLLLSPGLPGVWRDGRQRLGEPFDIEATASPSSFAVSADLSLVAAAGYWDNSVKCFSTVDHGRHVQSSFSHDAITTCLALSPTGLHFVTGSRGATVHVWRCPRAPFCPDEIPHAVLVGHELPVVAVAVDDTQDMVVSASTGACLVHTLMGKFLRRLLHPAARRAQTLRILTDGRILVAYIDKLHPTLAIFSINGNLLASVVTPNALVMDAVVDEATCVVYTGGFDCAVAVRSLTTLAVQHTFPQCSASIRTLALTPSRTALLVGTAAGTLAIYPLSAVATM